MATGARLAAVPVQWRGTIPEFGLPAALNVPRIGLAHWGAPYDVAPNGREIYMLRADDTPPPREIHLVIGWRALLQ